MRFLRQQPYSLRYKIYFLKVESIKAIFQEVFAAARNIELPERISYLGPEGSFTHQAAESNFGSQAKYLPINSIKSVFDSVESKKTKYGIIPLENNQEGIVQETIDLLGVSEFFVCVICFTLCFLI